MQADSSHGAPSTSVGSLAGAGQAYDEGLW
jgi:hypothetical protein